MSDKELLELAKKQMEEIGGFASVPETAVQMFVTMFASAHAAKVLEEAISSARDEKVDYAATKNEEDRIYNLGIDHAIEAIESVKRGVK